MSELTCGNARELIALGLGSLETFVGVSQK